MSEQISNMTYQQALERLNELVAQIEDPKMPVEQILGMVKRFPLHDQQSLRTELLHNPGCHPGTNAFNDPTGQIT